MDAKDLPSLLDSPSCNLGASTQSRKNLRTKAFPLNLKNFHLIRKNVLPVRAEFEQVLLGTLLAMRFRLLTYKPLVKFELK